MSMGVVSQNGTYLCSRSCGPFIALVDLISRVNKHKNILLIYSFFRGVQVEHYL